MRVKRSYRLQRGQYRQREGRDLDRASQQVADDEHEHANLPSSPSIRWTPVFVDVFLIFQDVGFSLEGQADALDTGRGQSDEDANLEDLSEGLSVPLVA